MGRRRRMLSVTNDSSSLLVLLIIFFFFIGALLVYLGNPHPEITFYVKIFENEPVGWTGVIILIIVIGAIVYFLMKRK